MPQYSVKYLNGQCAGFSGFYDSFEKALAVAEDMHQQYKSIFIFKDGQFFCEFDPQKEYDVY